ncbi:MAG: hypothetical protein AUH30_09785 [Candidatus Rokubacteria bacterium 13_1_40CM_68_15]|nr:MAG: hypothetical protein AUH30_09785 [Candidatus Rokubacteria bacterium 13_1_40CM_68_15]
MAPLAVIRRHPVAFAVGTLVLIALLVAGGVYYSHAAKRVSTDDAFIEARIIRISAKVAGQVEKVLVEDNQEVTEGQLLVQIDERPYRAVVDEARAQARAAEVEAENAEADATRARLLFERQLISRQDFEKAAATARAKREAAEAARRRLERAEVDLSYTRIVAPESGRVTRKSVEEGMYVPVGTPLMAIVTHDIWVIANFKETQLKNIRPGQPVEIKIDAYKGKVFKGHVDSIQSGTGARFSLLPPENATGNFVKVVQRVPVKIVFDQPPPPDYPVGPGMSVVPVVRVT